MPTLYARDRREKPFKMPLAAAAQLGICWPHLVVEWLEYPCYSTPGRAGMYLLIWTALIFLFFSKSSSKLIPYILPIFPPLAMLIGRRIDLLAGREILLHKG